MKCKTAMLLPQNSTTENEIAQLFTQIAMAWRYWMLRQSKVSWRACTTRRTRCWVLSTSGRDRGLAFRLIRLCGASPLQSAKRRRKSSSWAQTADDKFPTFLGISKHFCAAKLYLNPVHRVWNFRNGFVFPKNAAHQHRVTKHHQECRNSHGKGGRPASLYVNL